MNYVGSNYDECSQTSAANLCKLTYSHTAVVVATVCSCVLQVLHWGLG